MLGKMFCSLEYRDSWRQPGNADEKKKNTIHKMCLCAQRAK